MTWAFSLVAKSLKRQMPLIGLIGSPSAGDACSPRTRRRVGRRDVGAALCRAATSANGGEVYEWWEVVGKRVRKGRSLYS